MEPMKIVAILIKEAAKDIIAVSFHAYLHWNEKLAFFLSHALCYLMHVSIAFFSIERTIVFILFRRFRRIVEHYFIVFIILYNSLNNVFTFALFTLSVNVSPF